MIVEIKKEGDMLITHKDFREITCAGEISHMIVELELIKQDLIKLWDHWED